MEAIKTSSGSNQSQKKTKENESSKTESSELDGFIDPYGLKTETFSEEEMEQTGVNRDLDIEIQASDDAYISKRNSTETDISLSDKIGMPGNALITCENPRPVSVIQKTEINKYPVFIVQKLLPTQPLESPIIKLVSSDKEKTLKMSPSSLSRPRTSRKPYARKILPAILKMETNEMESATMPVREYKEKKLKKAKMYVKRMPLKKKTNSVKNKNVDDQVNADWPNKSTAASSNHSDCETSPDCLNNPEAMSSKDLEFDCPRPVLLVQNKSFARHNTQMSKFKNHQPSINHDNSLLTQNEATLTYDSEFQNIVKSIKTEPEEIQPEMQEFSRTGTGRESKEGPTCSQNKKDFERNDNNVNSDAARYCEKKQISKSGPTSQTYHSHPKPKSIYSNVTNSINPGHTVSIFSPTHVSTASLKSSINNLPLLASQVSSTACLRNVNIAPNNVGLSLSASQGAARPQTTVTNFLQGTVLATKCQSTTGMKLMTIPQKTITSMAKISGSKQIKISSPSTTTMVQESSRPISTTKLVSSPLIRPSQPNNLMFPRIPYNSPGLRHPAPFIVPQPDVHVTKAANTESPRILSSVSNQNIMIQTSTTGMTMSSQSLLISPPSLPQGPGMLNNSMFDQSLGGYRLGNIIIKTQNFSSGTLPQTTAVSTTLSPSIASIQGPSAHNQHLIIQGASIQSILSPAPGAIPSFSFQGTTSTGSASSPISSYQLPQTQGVNQNQIQSSPLIHFPVFSQLPGTMVNPGSSQGLFQNATFQTLHQQAPKGDPQLRVQEVKQQIPQVNLNLAKPGSKQQVSQGNSNLVKPGAKQQIPQVNLNLAKPGSKQQVSQGNSNLVKPGAKQQILPAKANWTLQCAKQQVSPTIPNPLVQRSKPIQSSTTPQMIVIAPNLPNNGTTQIQSTGSSQLSYSQMLKVYGNNSGTSFNQSNIPQVDLGLQTPKLGSSSSTLINLTKPTNLKQTSVSNQPAVLTMGPDISKENVPSSKGLSTSAIDDSPEDVGKISSLTLSNLKKNQPSLQTSELKAQEVTVSASESFPPSASPMVPTTTSTSLKEVPLKLGSEIKPIPSDIPGPYKAHDHDVLIHVKYKYRRSRNKTRSMYIHDPIWRSMIKGYIRRELNYRHLAKQLFQIPELVKEFHKLFLKQLEAECSVMCSSKTQTILRKVDPPDLENLKFEDVLSELQKDAPLMRSVLEAVRSEKCPDQNLGIIAALLLYSRSTFLSAVHHVITKILHNCGAHTKTIDLLSSLGLCSKSSSYFGNIKRYAARNNSEEFQNTLEDTQQCSDDTMDTGIDASDESVSSDQDFDIKSKLKDKILKKISPAKKLKRKRIKKMSKMKNIQSCSVSKKLKVSHRQKDVKMADSCDTFSVTLNSQGTLSNADRYKTAKSCNESGVPLMSAAKNNNNNNSAMNSFCDNVEIHDGFDQTSDRFK